MAAPTAGYSKVINYLTVAFTDTSVNSPTTWLWDFGDGNTSNTQNPVHVYALPGSYTVTLTVTNADGSDQETQAFVVGLPQALFRFTSSLLLVDFTDTSTNTPTSWSWDFGDGSPVDTNQHPSYTYATAGTYTVTLTVANAGGSSSFSRNIHVSTSPVLPLSLSDFIDAMLPNGLPYDQEYKDALIAKWQLYLAPLVTPAISDDVIFNEQAYPPLVNALIAALVAYDIFINAAQQAYIAFVASSQISQNQTSSSGSGSSSVSGAGGVKKIITGPSEVEWFNVTQGLSNYFRTTAGNSLSSGSFGATGGPLDTMLRDICMLAARLNIMLPMCPRLPKKIFAPQIMGRSYYQAFETRNLNHLGMNTSLVGYYYNGYITI